MIALIFECPVHNPMCSADADCRHVLCDQENLRMHGNWATK